MHISKVFVFTILKYFRSSTDLKNHVFAPEGYQKSKCRPSLKESRQALILESILNDFRTPQIPFSPQSAPQGRKMTHTIQWHFPDLKNTKRSARGTPQGEAICDTSRVRGELGSIWEASWEHLGDIWGHLGPSGDIWVQGASWWPSVPKPLCFYSV